MLRIAVAKFRAGEGAVRTRSPTLGLARISREECKILEILAAVNRGNGGMLHVPVCAKVNFVIDIRSA